MTKPVERCDHWWLYPQQALISGRDGKDEVVAVRCCMHCDARQMAFTKPWRKATGDYALDEHYKDTWE